MNNDKDRKLQEAHKYMQKHLSLHPHPSLYALTSRTSVSHVLTCVTMPPQHDKCKQKVYQFITVEEGGTNYTTENYDSFMFFVLFETAMLKMEV